MLKNILATIGVIAIIAFAANACVAQSIGDTLGGSGSLQPNSTLNTDAWPPVRFQGDNTATIAYVDPTLIDMLCGKAPNGWKTQACTTGNVTILPNPCTFPHDDAFAKLACHESAHLPRANNVGDPLPGWPREHGDSRTRL